MGSAGISKDLTGNAYNRSISPPLLLNKPMKPAIALASIVFSVACINFAGNAHATNIYVKYGPASFCKVTVNPSTDILSDTLGGTYSVGSGVFTSAGDQFVQGTLDTATCGTSTGSPPPAFATSTAAVIVASPSNVQGTSNSTTLSWGMQNATQCAASATFTPALPAGSGATVVTGISGWPSGFCSTAGTCNGLKSASLTGLNTGTVGTYAFTLTCLNASNASVSSTASVNVTTVVVTNCPAPVVPSGLTLQTSIPVLIGTYQNLGGNAYTGSGGGSTSDFASVFGVTGDSGKNNYNVLPGRTDWPGVSGQSLYVSFNQDNYIALLFKPSGSRNGTYSALGTSGQPQPSFTISPCPGDFRIGSTAQTNPALPAACSASSGNSLQWDTNTSSTSTFVCHLTPGQPYYVNMIQAQLSNATTKPVSLCTGGVCQAQVVNTFH